MTSNNGPGFWMSTRVVVVVGLAVGVGAALLQVLGNPGNMGLCVVCFLRDIAGGLGLHDVAPLRYLRPEVSGIILGALVASLTLGGFRSRGSSSSMLYFVLGNLIAIGALVFMGCSTRMVLRLGGGDLNAVIGLAGFVAGVFGGLALFRGGFSLGTQRPASFTTAMVVPVLAVVVMVLLLFQPVSPEEATGLIQASEKGPGVMHPRVWISLCVGLAIGFLLQRTAICTVACVRAPIDIGVWRSTWGLSAMLVGALVVSVAAGSFQLGFEGQPLAHTDHLYNFLGLMLLGLAGTMASGCPLRQLVRAGEGDADAGFVVVGMLTGSVLAHRFLMASTPGGVAPLGPAAVIVGLVLCVVIGLSVRE